MLATCLFRIKERTSADIPGKVRRFQEKILDQIAAIRNPIKLTINAANS
jgi:hypothetical protein